MIISNECIKKAKAYLQDQFNDSGYSGWLEGWACGFTDHDHENSEEVHDELLDFVNKLRSKE